MTDRSSLQLRWDVLVVIGVLLVAVAAWKLWTRSPDPDDDLVIEVQTADPDRLVLVGAGDVDLSGRLVPLMNEHGVGYAFENLSAALAGDALMANLEAPVVAERADASLRDNPHWMRPRHLDALADAGFTLVSLANDHSMDQGHEGLVETTEQLRQRGIAWVGAGPDARAARRAVILDGGHTRVAVIGAFPKANTFREMGYYATEDRAGINPLDKAALTEDVARLEQVADVVVLSVHWGLPYDDVAGRQRALAEMAVEAGVDLIHGSGAHRAQQVELIDGVPVIYNVGNLTTGDPMAYDRKSPDMKLSCVARYGFRDGALDSLELLPLRTNNPRVEYQPRPPGARHARKEFEPRLAGVEFERQEDGWYRVALP